MNALTPLAVQNLDLLRLLAGGEVTTKAAAAAFLGRDPDNFNKTVKKLEAEGAVAWPSVTETGQRILAAADVAAGAANPVRDAASATPAAERVWTHADLTPNPLQPRKRFDPEATEQRAASMKRDGQLQNLVARPNPDAAPGAPALQIVSGEGRWRSAGLLIERGDWPADHPIKVDVRDLTDEQVLAIGLIENMQRRDLTPLEEARAFAELVKTYGRTTAEIAETISKTQRFVQIRLSLLNLTADEQARLESEEISFKDALRLLAARPKPLDLTPVKAMILAEVIAAATPPGMSGVYWRKAECDPIAAQDAIAAALIGEFLTFEGPDHFTGRFTLRFADHVVFDRFAAHYPDVIAADRAAGLLRVRAAALGADEAERLDSEGGYATDWLNGPFALTVEGQAILDQRQREDAENAVKSAQADAERALLARRLSEADGQTHDLLKALATPRPRNEADQLVSILEAAGARLPWAVADVGGYPALVDADGRRIELPTYATGAATIYLRVIMAAVNAAASMAPVIIEAGAEGGDQGAGDEDSDDDDHGFAEDGDDA